MTGEAEQSGVTGEAPTEAELRELASAVVDEIEPRVVRLLDLHARVRRIEGILQTHGMLAPLAPLPHDGERTKGGDRA